MKLHEVQYKAIELTKSAPGEGLHWDGCTSKDGQAKFAPPDNAIREAVTARMIRSDIDASGEKHVADTRVLDTCRKWNPELTLEGVTQMLDFAVQKAWGELTVPAKTSHAQKQKLRRVEGVTTNGLPV